jgi:NAD(P)H dehydrogenase (quinone)
MTVSVILAHPYEKSFNHAIYNTVINELKNDNHKIYAHDLYKENFNPIMTCEELGTDASSDPLVQKYTEELIESDGIIFIHPNWWGEPPAILKGYIDRIFRPPHAYEFSEGDSGGGIPTGKLTDKIALVLNTSNTETDR